MALPIASIPELTGEVGRKFEEQAQKNYERYLNRTEEEIKADEESKKRRFEHLRNILAKAHLG